MASVSFLLTNNCNLRCKYCYQKENKSDNIYNKTSENVIDAFAEYCKKEEIYDVKLFGGEPLFYKNLFIYCVLKLKQIVPNIHIHLVTNGTLVDMEILNIIKENDISIILSLDGDRETHNLMRGGFDDILKWIPYFSNKSQISVALQAGQVKRLYDNIKYVWDLDFASGVYVNIIYNYGWYNETDIIMFEKEYEKAINGMLNGEGVLTCALSIFNFIEKNNINTNTCGIFTVGLASDWEGNLYPCQSAFLLGNKLCIGSIYSGIDSHKHKQIRHDIFNSINLSASSNKYKVASFCPISIYQKHNSFHGPWCDEFCQMIDIKAKLVAKYYYEIKKFCGK
jgi:uncharacterized protein